MEITDTTDIVFINTVNQSSLVISNIMLNEGITALQYEPYVEDVLRIPLVNGPLNAINDSIYDEIDIDPDRMEATIVRRTKKIKFTRIDANWAVNSLENNIFRFSCNTNKVLGSNIDSSANNRIYHISNKLPSNNSWSAAVEGFYIDTSLCAKIKADSQEDAEKRLFGGEGFIIIAILATPIYETVQLTKPHDTLHENGHIIASSDGVTPLVEITTK